MTNAKSPRSRPPVPAEKSAASTTDNRKQSLYFPEDMLDEISRASFPARPLDELDRAAGLARVARSPRSAGLPSVNDVFEGAREPQRRRLNSADTFPEASPNPRPRLATARAFGSSSRPQSWRSWRPWPSGPSSARETFTRRRGRARRPWRATPLVVFATPTKRCSHSCNPAASTCRWWRFAPTRWPSSPRATATIKRRWIRSC